MCCKCQKITVERCGYIFCFAFLVLAVVTIILGGVNYNITETNWANGAWKSLPAVEIASIVYVFFTFGFGFVAFCWCHNCLFLFIFLILLMISLLFTAAIAIFGLVAGSINRVNGYVGCNSQYQGVLQLWKGIDTYMMYVDSNLCSDSCPCKIDNSTGYVSNATILPYYNSWNKSGIAYSYPNCSEAVQKDVGNKFAAANVTDNYTMDQVIFASYWNAIETKFNCSGWCHTTYVNPYTNKESAMYKYMFTDVNRGPPVYLGCMENIANWLPQILASFGAIALALAILQAITWMLALSRCCQGNDKDKVEEKK